MTSLGSLFKGGKIYVAPLDAVWPGSLESGFTPPQLDVPSLAASLAVGQTAFSGQSTASILASIQAWIWQDEDAHDTCSLTACLNPLHPGPCKGWKGTLHSVSPGAWHAIEAARVEKANAARIKKIQALKAQGKPIPHKLLQEIKPKPNPQAGQTAQKATGEAHTAGQAVSDAAGVKTSTPGKVSLGQAVKPIPQTTGEKGPKGKKPTVASKGIAFVIAQEKVTPQYKLDKTASITPDQWAGLSEADKSVIRGELAQIQKDGFGPQQKKATDLLDYLDVQEAKAQANAVAKAQDANAAHQKAAYEAAKATPAAPAKPPESFNEKVLKVKQEMAKGSSLLDSIEKVTGKTAGGPDKVGIASIKVGDVVKGNLVSGDHTVAKIVMTNTTLNNTHGTYEFHDANGKTFFVGSKNAKAVLVAPGDGKAPTPGPAVTVDKDKVSKILEQAKAEPPKAITPTLTPKLPDSVPSPKKGSKDNYGVVSKPKVGGSVSTTSVGLPPGYVLSKDGMGYSLKHKGKLIRTSATQEALEKYAHDHAAGNTAGHAPSAGDTLKEAAKQVHQAKVDEAAATTSMTGVNVGKLIHKSGGSVDLMLGGKKVTTGFEGGGHEGTLTFTPALGVGGGTYTVTTKDGQKHTFGKGELIKVADAKPTTLELAQAASKPEAVPAADKPKPLPAHVEDAIAMAKGQAPGASWSKNHLAAYQKLSPEEFHGLPKDVQGKVVAELQKAQTKFLDPKKVTASKELLAKFGVPETAQKVTAPKIENVGFSSHLHDHSVTAAQAKEAVKSQTPAAWFLVAKTTAGLTALENPDGAWHPVNALDDAKTLVDLKTKFLDPAVLNTPDVKASIAALKTAAGDQSYIQSVKDAKEKALNKVSIKLASDKGELSPIEKASLVAYEQHLLYHPVDTGSVTLDAAKAKTKTAEGNLMATIKEGLLKAHADAAGGAAGMSDAQIADRAKKLLGPEATNVQVNLDLGELKYANNMGMQQAIQAAQGYPSSVLEQPAVATKFKALASVAGQYVATQAMQKKLADHLKVLHEDTLLEGHSITGAPLTADDVKVIKRHAEIIKAQHAYLDNTAAEQKPKVTAFKNGFIEAALKAGSGTATAPAPGSPFAVTLTDYDQKVIKKAYSHSWYANASKAVTYGLKTYSQKDQMKAHPDYEPLLGELGGLRDLAGEVAVAHAERNTAKQNVPTDPETGATLLGPGEQAYVAAQQKVADLEQQFSKGHKLAQARLDTIRLAVGLKKRALPKFDAPAVKTAAAESGFYKTTGYDGPNYGKQASAKQYMLAKVGPDLAVAHQTAAEKKAGKPSSSKPGSAAYVPPPTTQKTKSAFPSVGEAGANPNATAAAKFGFTHVAQVGAGDTHGWPGGGDPAYVANEAILKDLEGHLSNPETKFGLGAQKEFKWSINNMESKGASTAGKKSLFSYTGNGYTAVNAKLNSIAPGAKKTGSTTVSNIDAAMAASPPLEGDVVLYRGFKNPHSVFSSGKWNDVNVAGMEWSQRSYSSTSGALATAQSFGSGGVVMRVIIPKEMKVKGINAKGGQHSGENEIILQRGLRYRVVADYGKKSGTRYIDVMVVPNPYDQAE